MNLSIAPFSIAFALAWVLAWMPSQAPASAVSTGPNTRAAKATPKQAAQPSAPYSGRFTSGCDKMAEGLYTQDIVVLQPLAADRVQAAYHKAMYTADSCSVASRLVTMHLPVATWQLDGQVKLATPKGSLKADRVTVHMPAGQITATPDQADKVKETDKAWVLAIGDEQVPIEKATDALADKDLRLIENGVLYFGDPGSPDAQGYPQEALRNQPMKRVKAK